VSILDEPTKAQVKEALAPIQHELEVIVYTSGSGLVIPGRDMPGEQRPTLELLREIAELSDKIKLEERPLAGDEEAQNLGITLAPTILLREAGTKRTNIRFSGLPGGYEFTTLISTLHMLGTGESELGATSMSHLEKVESPVHLQVFVTPTCPHCPRAVLTAFKFAYHNANIVAEGIEANEFPMLSQRNRISGVPDTIVRGANQTRVLGAQPDRAFVEAVLNAAAIEDGGGSGGDHAANP
jgi:glutaredoxin-like protein